MKSVYLSGPIANLSYGECTSWREDAEQALDLWGIKALSPMRGKDFLKEVQKFDQLARNENPMSTARGIMTRDFYDSTTCDAMLVHLLGAEKVSIGTVLEIGFAYSKRTPIIAVMEADGSNVHEHAMIQEAIGYRVEALHEAIHLIRHLFGIKPPLEKPLRGWADSPRVYRQHETVLINGEHGRSIVGGVA